MDAPKLLHLQNHRKGSVAVDPLLIMILIAVFAIIMFIIIINAKNGSAEQVGALCKLSGGLFGC